MGFALAGGAACTPDSAMPPPLISNWNAAFVRDAHFVWHGTAQAAGVVVWAHGRAGPDVDLRGLMPPPLLRPFNDAGFDVVRFDRQPMADDVTRAAGWLRDGLAALRQQGYKLVIAAGQSRGAWNALQMLDTPGLADGIIALSPAAQGSGRSMNLSAQYDDLRAMIATWRSAPTHVVIAQFDGDPFTVEQDAHAAMFRAAFAQQFTSALLLNRPAGFQGHDAGEADHFAGRYGACLLRFITTAEPSLSVCDAVMP